jgi:hypothetical protein
MGIGISTSYFPFSPVSIIQPMIHTHHLKLTLIRRTRGRSLGNLQSKSSWFQCRTAMDKQALSLFSPPLIVKRTSRYFDWKLFANQHFRITGVDRLNRNKYKQRKYQSRSSPNLIGSWI